MNDNDWLDRAACKGMDIDLFFPVAGTGHATHVVAAEAKAVCAGCPVRAECLEDSFTMRPDAQVYGVWGGMTPNERLEIRKQRAGGSLRSIMRPCGTVAAYSRGCRCDECRRAKYDYMKQRRAS